YQFSHVCSEEAVGCSAFYNTFNSDSAYAEVRNARCVYGGDGSSQDGLKTNDFQNGVAVKSTKDCLIDGTSYCKIASGSSYCVFSSKQKFAEPLLRDDTKHLAIVYGPETVLTQQDQPLFAIDNGSNMCSDSFKGCREIAKPTYAQDLKTVTKFDSIYMMDVPKDYDKILCENEALFCEEFSSTNDGNFYFKNPQNKTCEYKTSVTIGQKLFSGWFRKGTSDPCYWTDVAPLDGKYDSKIDSAYLSSGTESNIRRNGDFLYDGWVGSCASEANRCSEYIEVTDTSVENHGNGKSYTVIHNDKLDDAAVSETKRCNGKVGQKGGCALFNNATLSQLKYNTNASYVLSLHADALLATEANVLVNPINCNGDNGKFPISNDTAAKLKLAPNPGTIDLCARRCQYTVDTNDKLLSSLTKADTVANKINGRSCFEDADCPTLQTQLGKSVQGACSNMTSQAFRLPNDANTILKVNRDRTCAAWLACKSSHTSWDPNNGKYVHICDAIGLCSEAGDQGGQTSCEKPIRRDPVILSEPLYTSRDVSWAGLDYSGYAIPNQLPVERYSQENLNPRSVCYSQLGGDFQIVKKDDAYVACDDQNKCANGESCKPLNQQNNRLVYNAGTCSGLEGSTCKVGVCAGTQKSCSANEECTKGTNCVVGYYQIRSETTCVVDADCASQSLTKKCDQTYHRCVDVLSSDPNKPICSTDGDSVVKGETCFRNADAAVGTCFNHRCLTDIRDGDKDGFADVIAPKMNDLKVEAESCRGYPETDSPFPKELVKNCTPE
ncbi:MAG: hypothetical protein AAB664_04405, partial [Patescibacteria group bacterium]